MPTACGACGSGAVAPWRHHAQHAHTCHRILEFGLPGCALHQPLQPIRPSTPCEMLKKTWVKKFIVSELEI
eukprot:9479037-Pyramimonas_sp.AAC.1